MGGVDFLPDIEQKFQKRQTAYKVRVRDILNSKYTKTEGSASNYLEMNEKKISRVNVVGVIVQKLGLDNYKTIMIDDGTGRISTRVFEENVLLDKVDVGDIVLIIGRPREFSSEKYIIIETIKKINPIWAKVRKLEFEKNVIKEDVFSNKVTSNNENITEEIVDLTPTNKIVKLIREFDKGNGVSIEELSSKNIKDMDKIIDMLLKGGDIFEVKPGKLKVLE
jgi:RPA family protein